MDDVLRAALGNTYLRRIDHVSPTIINLLSKAVESLELSEETIYQACESREWIIEKVLARWPNAPLSEEALVAALSDKQKFHILMEKRPSIEISAGVIETVYQLNDGSENTLRTIIKVLELQPNTTITENLLETVSLRHYYVDDGVHGQLFNILLRRVPHAKLTNRAFHNCMTQSFSLAQLTLEARPGLELKVQIILHHLLLLLSSPGLDEKGMLEFIPGCTPTVLIAVLSSKPDAMVTESVINSLLKSMNSAPILRHWMIYLNKDTSITYESYPASSTGAVFREPAQHPRPIRYCSMALCPLLTATGTGQKHEPVLKYQVRIVFGYRVMAPGQSGPVRNRKSLIAPQNLNYGPGSYSSEPSIFFDTAAYYLYTIYLIGTAISVSTSLLFIIDFPAMSVISDVINTQFLEQWKNPGDVFSVLLIVGGDIVLLALACLTVVVGDNKLLVRCLPEISLKVINLKNGYCRENKSWLLGRFNKDYNFWMPGDVKERLLRPRVRCDEENTHAKAIPSDSSTIQKPIEYTVTLGRSDTVLCIAVFKWIDGAVPGLPSRIAAIPWGLHSNWGIFLATAIRTLLAYLSASLPQWRQEKWSAASREKDVAVTIGNGNRHVIVILGAQHGSGMKDLATSRTPDLLSTCIYTSLLAVFWLVLLVTCCGIKTDSWYLLAVGGLGMAQNLMVASVPRTPAALSLPIELVSSGNEDQIVPEIFAEPKVMWTIMEFEDKHCGLELLEGARRKAWRKAHEAVRIERENGEKQLQKQ
ncbi:hypothetical protein BOTNAR_0454g00060 [Botryotinia narcissicola]|uniref:Uncharacterized protein n=1 Tax=Botryotinia narcissicola TaxID=278944 RepID=A0A4Z1HVZ7_9HELO|nr:hypothetical protein BOTNAR_0454g00060 [Botryotinia narcissicola]